MKVKPDRFSFPPLIWVCISLAMGIIFAKYYPLHQLHGIMICSAIFALLYCFFYKKFRLLFLIISVFSFGTLRNSAPPIPAPLYCEGIWEITDFSRAKATFGQSINIKSINSHCTISADIIASRYLYDNLPIGKRFFAKLTLKSHNYYYYTTLKELQWTQDQSISIASIRGKLSQHIEQTFSPFVNKWMQALLIGNQTQLSSKDRNVLQRTGTSHLIAVSGLHLGIIIATIFFTVQYLWSLSRQLSNYISPRSIALLIGLMAAGVYVLLTGAHPPVIRAWLMFTLLTSSWFFATFHQPFTSLLFTIIVVLFMWPETLFSLSAWLSFIATAGVISLWRHCHQLSPLQQWIIIQSGISLMLTPVIWGIFGGISISAFFINLLVIPWLGVLLAISYLALLFSFLSPIANFLAMQYFRVIQTASNWEWSYLIPNIQPTVIAGIALSLSILSLFLKQKLPTLFLFFVAVGAQVFTYQQTFYQAPTKIPLAIVFMPEHTVIINAGYKHKNRDDAERHLLPTLRQHFRKPDAIILTSKSAFATTALKTILTAYPEIKIYSLSEIKNIPFNISHCPDLGDTHWLQFTRNKNCSVVINHQFRVTNSKIDNISQKVQR